MTGKVQPLFPLAWILSIVLIVFTAMLVGTTMDLDVAQRRVVERDRQIVELGDHFIPLLTLRIQALRDRVEISEMKFSHERWRMKQDHPDLLHTVGASQ